MTGTKLLASWHLHHQGTGPWNYRKVPEVSLPSHNPRVWASSLSANNRRPQKQPEKGSSEQLDLKGSAESTGSDETEKHPLEPTTSREKEAAHTWPTCGRARGGPLKADFDSAGRRAQACACGPDPWSRSPPARIRGRRRPRDLRTRVRDEVWGDRKPTPQGDPGAPG